MSESAPNGWREFRDYDAAAIEWIRGGGVAITPGVIERIGKGVCMYLHAGTPTQLAGASRAIDASPPSDPKRTGANIDGEFLMRAIVKCRRDRLGPSPTATAVRLALPDFEPWNSKCPECGAKFFTVAEHSVTLAGDVTSAACVRGHRWKV